MITGLKLKDGALAPTRAYDGDAGYDLYASQATLCEPQKYTDIPTGVHVALPPGIWLHMVGRSSTLRNSGLLVISAVIDCGYRGELFFGVFNTNHHPVAIDKHQRLAQVVPHQILTLNFQLVDELPTSERGNNGFGSSGR